MKITTLAENITYQRGLISEHGFSVLIEKGHTKILFDTGQGYALIHNADQLGIDLGEVDHIVISHGHFDHAGGLDPLLDINSKANVYLKKEAMTGKYKGNTHMIGMTMDPAKLNGRASFVDSPTEIAGDVWVMPEIPLVNPDDKGFAGFRIKTGQKDIQDVFNDEQYLAMIEDGGLIVISGCSHRGITNILHAASSRFNLPIRMVLGGFHLRNASPSRLSGIVEKLHHYDPSQIGVCHCTGIDAYCKLRQVLGDKVFYNSCGNVINITVNRNTL